FSASAMKRAITSVPPPAGKPTMILSVLSGRAVLARTIAGDAKAAPARVKAERRLVIFVTVRFSPLLYGTRLQASSGRSRGALLIFTDSGLDELPARPRR